MSEETEADHGSRPMPPAIRKGLISVQGGNQYLKAPFRVMWMREEHPDWEIKTQVVEGGYEAGFVVVKATICNEQGRTLATSHKEEKAGKFPFLSKAETGAIARALALVGYGTQFGEIDDDGPDSVADSPIPRGGGNRPHDTDANGEVHNLPTRPPLTPKQTFRNVVGTINGALSHPQFTDLMLAGMVKAICEDTASVEAVATHMPSWEWAKEILVAFRRRCPEATPESILQEVHRRFRTDLPMSQFTAGMWQGAFTGPVSGKPNDARVDATAMYSAPEADE